MRIHKTKWMLLTVFGILLTAWAAAAFQTARVNDNALKGAPQGTEWLTYGMGYSEQRYSTMTQIDPSNVGQLGQAWSFDLGPGGGPQSATPLYANGVIYAITNWSVTFAVDAATGREIWRHDPQADRAMIKPGASRLCCGIISRGVALYEDKVIVPVIDGRLQALDAATGKLLWSVLAIPEPETGQLSSYSITMAPRVADGKIFIGNAGAEFPPYRGYVSAFDVNSGKELWRLYTVPGDPSKPFESKAMETAASTWTGEWWKMGGGGSYWDGMAYDPEANLLYVGTGNGTPWSQDVRQGQGTEHLDNLYVASILALDADTGELKWHYQCTPGDQWDYDAIQHLMLADLQIGGRERKVVMQANKNGYFYVLDRITGEFISGEAMAPISWASGLDPKTGRPTINPEAYYTAERGATISPLQTHNTSQMAFNPSTGLVYVPIAPAGSFNFTAQEKYTPTPGLQNFGLVLGARGPMAVPPAYGPVRDVRGGILSAWDPVTQKERWFAEGGGNRAGGVVSTASNLVIQVTPQGRLRAYTADKGERLLDIATGQTDGMGPPITYMHQDKQYVAVMGGTGAAPGMDAFGFNIGPPRGQAANAPPPPPNPRLYVFTLNP